VLDYVKELKLLLDPCEVRIQRNDYMYKDARNSHLDFPHNLREIVLIGS
jgi:hypothetical protein